MIRGNSLPICAATVRSASCIAVRPASAEKSVNGSLRNSGSAMGLLQVLTPEPCGGLQRLSIRRMRDRRKDGGIQGNLVTVAASRASTRLGRASDHKVLDLLRSLGTWRKNERGDHSDRRAADTRACCNLHLHLLLLFLGHLRHLPLLLHSGFSIPGAATSCVRGV